MIFLSNAEVRPLEKGYSQDLVKQTVVNVFIVISTGFLNYFKYNFAFCHLLDKEYGIFTYTICLNKYG